MAGSFLSKESLMSSMHYFSRVLRENKFEHFLFFGSLLGAVRDGHPIAGDDDVDFYVNKKHFFEVCNMLTFMGIEIDYHRPPNSHWFLQVEDFLNGQPIRVDFYFYDAQSDRLLD